MNHEENIQLGKIIKKLQKPPINWTTYITDDEDDFESEYEDVGIEPPPVPHRIKYSVSTDNHDDPKPELPPRDPIKKSSKLYDATYDPETLYSRNPDRENLEEVNHSDRECYMCQRGNVVPPSLSIDHDELHRLQEKEDLSKKRNEFDRAKIEKRQTINKELKETLKNRTQLNKLEMEELNIETAISDIGKPSQMDEYYEKGLFNVSTTSTSNRESSEDQLYRLSVKHSLGNTFGQLCSRRLRCSTNVSRYGQKPFSSKIYAADSGIGYE